MTIFHIDQKSSQSIFDQVASAAIKMILSGELKRDEPFPSIRKMAADLKIHPNTAHKVVQHLIKEKWLISVPGKGTIVAYVPVSTSVIREKLLTREINELIAEAKRLGVSQKAVITVLKENWTNANELKVASNDN